MDKQIVDAGVPQLRAFLDRYKATPEVIEAAAADAGTKHSYLTQIAGGHRQAGGALAIRLERVIPEISRADLRPDLFGDVTLRADT